MRFHLKIKESNSFYVEHLEHVEHLFHLIQRKSLIKLDTRLHLAIVEISNKRIEIISSIRKKKQSS